MRTLFDPSDYAFPIDIVEYFSNCWLCSVLTFYHIQSDLIRNRLTDTLRSERQDKRFIQAAEALTAFGIHCMEKGYYDRSRPV